MRKLLLISAATVAWAGYAHAGDVALGLGYFGTSTDNIRRTATDPKKEWTNAAMVGVAYRENGAKLAAHATAQAEYRDYHRDTLPNDTLFYVDSAALWTILPQRFTWTLQDRYDQVPRDASLAFTPANREAINVFSTGPDVQWNLTPINVIVLGARYGNTHFDERNDDHNRYTGILRWRYTHDQTTNTSLNFESQKIKHTTDPSPPAVVVPDDYGRDDLYVRFDRRNPSSRLVLDLGESRVDPSTTEELQKSLVRFNLAWNTTSTSALGLGFSREYLDIGSSLLATIAAPSGPEPFAPAPALPPDIAAGDVFYSERTQLFYRRDGEIGTEVSVYQRDLDYTTISQDRRETGGRVRLSYANSPTLTTTVAGQRTDYEYRNIVRDDEETTYSILFSYRATPRVTVGLEGQRNTRDSSDPQSEYTETRFLLGLTYNTNQQLTPVARR